MFRHRRRSRDRCHSPYRSRYPRSTHPFHRRSRRYSAAGGFALGILEFIAFLTTLRFFYRLVRRALGLPAGGLWREGEPEAAVPAEPALGV